MPIRILDASDADIYREIRLKALKENPDAFLSTYEAERQKPIEITKQNLQPSDSKFTLGCFTESNQLIGIVTFVQENNPKIVHKGNVFGMYVTPEFRGKRLGYALMTELLQRAKACKGLEQLNLTVVSNNSSAKRLYESVGFTAYGIERNALKVDGHYLDEDLMVLSI